MTKRRFQRQQQAAQFMQWGILCPVGGVCVTDKVDLEQG